MESLIEEILEIADGTPAEKGAVALARLRIDTRKWMMSKLAPKKYGDKLDVEVDDKRPRTPEERQARIAELLEMRNGNGGSDVAPVPEPKLH